MNQSPTSCPSPDRLRGMLSGEVAQDELDALTRHVETCSACQKTLDQWLASRSVHDLGKGDSNAATQEAALHDLMARAKKRDTSGDATLPPAGETAGTPIPLDPPRQPGHLGRLGHYEVLEQVGAGGMGIVLKAFDEKLHRIVAIKVMAPELAASGTARQRFVREARAAAAVAHDHVVAIHAIEEDHRPPYIVMQFIDGQSLQEKIDKEGTLELREILRIGLQTAEGLAAAHKHGLVHRDIKPANILLENGVERVKITDFGLARAVDDASLTQSGVVAGTPAFMSPEQANGVPLDHRSDLFSLGSVLYAMCTGRLPFRATGNMAVLLRVVEETPRPIREINNEIPEWLEAIIAKLHAKKPEERYQTARHVADVLSAKLAEVQFSGRAGRVSDRREGPATLTGSPHTPVAHAPGLPNSRPLVFASVFFALIASVVAAIVYWSGDGVVVPPEPKPPVIPVDVQAPAVAVAPFNAAKAKEHQDTWAKHLGVEPEITNSIGM